MGRFILFKFIINDTIKNETLCVISRVESRKLGAEFLHLPSHFPSNREFPRFLKALNIDYLSDPFHFKNPINKIPQVCADSNPLFP